ncbi:hypothetical protein V3C99_011315 [Haemonchus contortus]|uniref:Uncharacterized protein n=1 Tax=Haemonchus contortus TaxID=6289 RepID=A0A7I5E7Y2_HAECO
MKLLCTTASATTTVNLKRINTVVARLHGITTPKSSLVQVPEGEEIAFVRDTATSPVDLSSSMTTSTQAAFKSSTASTQTGEPSRRPLPRTLFQIRKSSASPTPMPSTSARSPSPKSERSEKSRTTASLFD